ncbi:SUKH-4 family immunity protein [Streptomyces sp. RKAG290]|uniref:SUKH-4 family immunity protein n=1 Tax=Streptomyces sp. RKAG290 TaxID=2888348 RepID=UPI00203454D2|nr:SUKH-4 family immunity protein [Streptomyces sp. RKAG290]MCM2411078.1 SUKH-4 family immunity protein [Streptomyces sp. RKAG290]
MIFELSREELIQTFGEERVHQAPSETAQAAGFSGETLTFLTDTGLPENEFISFPELDGADGGFRPVSVEELGSTWNLPVAAAHWVFLGNFEISAIVADTRTGELYQLAEGIMRPVPLHRDLSSLVHTIRELSKIVGSLPEDYEDDEELIEALGESLDALKSEIGRRDPRPFSNEHCEWVEIVTNIGAGMWGQGQQD